MNIPVKTLEYYNMDEHEYKWRIAKHDFLEQLSELELDELSAHGDTYKKHAMQEAYDILVEKWGEHIRKGPAFASFFEEHSDEDNSKE